MRNSRQARWFVLLALFFVDAYALYALADAVPDETLTVAFLDVGQGDAVFIETGSGRQMLVDGGPPIKKVLYELGKLMPAYDRTLDVVVATHPDRDHIGGLSDVLRSYQVPLLLEPGLARDTSDYESLTALLSEKDMKRIIARRGQRIYLEKNIFLDILSPEGVSDSADSNDASVIMKLSYGTQGFLLTGDAPQAVEKRLVAREGKNLESEVLKAGHHGSKTSSSGMLLFATEPDYTVISAGKDNQYGHPHAEVVARIEKTKSAVLRTDALGTIIFKTDGRNLVVE